MPAVFTYAAVPGSPTNTDIMSTTGQYKNYCVNGIPFMHTILYTLAPPETFVSMTLVGVLPSGLTLVPGLPGMAQITGTPNVTNYDSYKSSRLSVENCYKDISDPNNLEPLKPSDLSPNTMHYTGLNWTCFGYNAYCIDNAPQKFSFQIMVNSLIPGPPPVPQVAVQALTITILPATIPDVFKSKYPK